MVNSYTIRWAAKKDLKSSDFKSFFLSIEVSVLFHRIHHRLGVFQGNVGIEAVDQHEGVHVAADITQLLEEVDTYTAFAPFS